MTSTRRDRFREPEIHSGGRPPAAAIALLLQAYQIARAKQRDVWDFAVGVEEIRTAGVAESQLRELILTGYVSHAVEETEPDSPRRIIHPVENLGLWSRSCFVLTEAGVAEALQEMGQTAVPKPVWKARKRELRWGDLVVKRFEQPADVQEMVLAQFQQQKWRECIADPLPSVPGLGRKKRLQDTIGNLNRCHLIRVIRFGGGGDGKSIRWWRIADPEV